MRPDAPGPGTTGAPVLRVASDGAAWAFDGPFRVGRDPACEVCFEGHARVSRTHLRVYPVEGRWWVEDLDSANGLLVGGVRVKAVEVSGTVAVQLGDGGPHLTLDAPPVPEAASGAHAVEPSPPAVRLDDRLEPAFAAPPPSPRRDAPGAVTDRASAGDGAAAPPPRRGAPDETDGLSYEEVVKHYFAEGDDDGSAGERTRVIRQAYSDIQRTVEREHTSRERRYRVLILASLMVGVLAVGYAGYREYSIRQLRAQAQELFYQLRTYDVAVAQQVVAVERQIEDHPESADSLRGQLDLALETRRQTAARYDQFVRGLGVYDGLSSEEEAIYRVARAFGESELMIPPEFVDEVKTYIARWRNSNRFQTAVRTAQVNGYIPLTVDALRRNGLPPEFFYLSMQESNFDTRAVGPPTRYGYAKGAWQFIPETGQRYGLEPGPLVAQRTYDPLDERQQFDLAVDAAARYLHDIYVHLSQASGLLVCASYNWGEHRVRQKMRGIANDPEHRTYWRFLTEYRHRMPDETKGYVMNIFAAAVIGQNPRLFGIDMEPPLAAALAGGGGIAPDARADPSRPRGRLGTSALERRRTP